MYVLSDECLRLLRCHIPELSRQPNIPLDYVALTTPSGKRDEGGGDMHIHILHVSFAEKKKEE